MAKYDWLNKKTPRSIDQLRLWPENPRLNPEETHLTLSDFVEDFISTPSDQAHFLDLIKSIANDGFIPADPIVVWKNDRNGKFYVAEGNRRVAAIKVIRNPEKAPKSIRSSIKRYSAQVDDRLLEKILVNIAPTFEDAEWYINQRNNASSLQRPWSRIQQQRWIYELYEKYNGDIEKIKSTTKMEQGEFEAAIRILKIKDILREDFVKSQLSQEEFERASSHKFPITILERFFSDSKVRAAWGLDYDGIQINLKSEKESFLRAYAALIKRILDNKHRDDKIDTRTITTKLDEILKSLPEVYLTDGESQNLNIIQSEPSTNTSIESVDDKFDLIENSKNDGLELKNNPNRSRLILPIYEIHTDSYRISGLFDEFQRIPYQYKNSISASLRVFIDLAVFKYIETENLETKLSAFYKKQIKDISLKDRIEYLKQNCLADKAKKIAARLVDSTQEFSLDVLNGFVHSQDSHYLTKSFLNRFWDFLFPLLETLLDIRERK
jgi:hypothetical protein